MGAVQKNWLVNTLPAGHACALPTESENANDHDTRGSEAIVAVPVHGDWHGDMASDVPVLRCVDSEWNGDSG